MIRPIPEGHGVGFCSMEQLPQYAETYREEQIGRYWNYYVTTNCQKWPENFDNDDCYVIDGFSPNVEKSAIRSYSRHKVRNVWKLQRTDEQKVYAKDIGNERKLFHGSAVRNWVGILSRGLLLPKIVVSLGVHRTDAGWLGNGIYFGDAICTSCGYASPGKRRTKFVAVAAVALGKIKQFKKITYGINKAPDGFHSCHGVRGSEFSDDEYVVYEQNQQKLEYLVEIED